MVICRTILYSRYSLLVALGPWAPDPLAPLGIRLPLGIKRGYHRHFRPRGNAGLARPVVDAENGYCITPMEQGISENRTGDQHDAYSIAAWLRRADHDGSLAAFLAPLLTPSERTVAQVEGWILGLRPRPPFWIATE